MQTLLAACRKYLVDHPGIVSFACGTLAVDHAREVNDRDWDVGLHIVFTDKAAHDQYQDAPRTTSSWQNPSQTGSGRGCSTRYWPDDSKRT